jgi:MFS family permease
MKPSSPSKLADPPAPTPKTLENFDRAYATRIMLIMAAMVMTVMYIEGMLTPSLPQISQEFGVDYSQVSLVLSAYLITGVALSPIAGKLGDIYGKKHVLSVVLVIYTVAVSVTGFSPSFTFMVASRAIQGVGLTIFPLAMSLVREEFPREMVPKAQGLLSGLFGAGFAVSLPLGAFVSNSFGWRWTYHSAIPVVVLITIATIIVLRESPYRRPNAFIDYVGAGFLAGSLACIVLALSQGPSWGWTSFSVLALFATGGILLVPTALVEILYHRRGKEVILDVRLLSERNVMVANLVLTVAGFAMFLAFQAFTFRLDEPVAAGGFAQDTFHIGLSFVAFAIPMLIFAPLASLFVTRVGTKPLTLLGSIVGAVGFYAATRAGTLVELLLSMFVIGAGLAILNSSVINILVLTVEPRDMGLATAMNATFRNVGSALGAPLAGSLMSTYTVLVMTQIPGTPYSSLQQQPNGTAFLYAFLIAAVALLLAGFISLFAKEILGKRAHKEALASDERDEKPVGTEVPALGTPLRAQS